MATNSSGPHSAASSTLGYLYQVRYALLESLRRIRKDQTFIVHVEGLDDVVFEATGKPLELLQTKHHLKKAADLTDSSVDLWRTIRVWCDAIAAGAVPPDSVFMLITTATASKGHAAAYLKSGPERDPKAAMDRLNSVAETSTNKENMAAYAAYKALDRKRRKALLESIVLIDNAADIQGIDAELREILYFVVEERFLDSFLQRLEGWWYRRTIDHLVSQSAKPILSEEFVSETTSLREQFKQENLPIDDDIMRASVDASGYQDRVFVHQLRLIEIGNERIFHAIRNFYRAFEQRARWIREDLVLVGELDQYEDRLAEEWDLMFQQMKDELGGAAAEQSKLEAAQALYKWTETHLHPQIRPGVTEPSIARGTYQMLSESQRVGWHLEFHDRLVALLAQPATK